MDEKKKMRVLNITSLYSEFSRGGTESYIDNLHYELSNTVGISSALLVLRYSSDINNLHSGEILAISKDTEEADVQKIMEEKIHSLQPDFILVHTVFTWEYLLPEIARKLNIQLFFFFHAAEWYCNLFFVTGNGRNCEKLFSMLRCAWCVKQKTAEGMLGFIRTMSSEFLRLCRISKCSWYHEQMLFKKHTEKLLKSADRVIVFTKRDCIRFEKNGISPEHILVIPQGLSENVLEGCRRNKAQRREGKFIFGYVGRVCEYKGVHFLVQAAGNLPRNYNFELRIFGCRHDSYTKRLTEIAKHDSRIIFFDSMPFDRLLPQYGKVDVLCIPSIVNETGPLTLYEGVYSGCYVGGSRHLGQYDFLEKYGMVIPEDSTAAWQFFLQDCLARQTAIRQRQQELSFDNYVSMAYCVKKIIEKFD